MDKEKTHEERLKEWNSLTPSEQIRRYYEANGYPDTGYRIPEEKLKAMIAFMQAHRAHMQLERQNPQVRKWADMTREERLKEAEFYLEDGKPEK